jgi:hypothetical protein
VNSQGKLRNPRFGPNPQNGDQCSGHSAGAKRTGREEAWPMVGSQQGPGSQQYEDIRRARPAHEAASLVDRPGDEQLSLRVLRVSAGIVLVNAREMSERKKNAHDNYRGAAGKIPADTRNTRRKVLDSHATV